MGDGAAEEIAEGPEVADPADPEVADPEVADPADPEVEDPEVEDPEVEDPEVAEGAIEFSSAGSAGAARCRVAGSTGTRKGRHSKTAAGTKNSPSNVASQTRCRDPADARRSPIATRYATMTSSVIFTSTIVSMVGISLTSRRRARGESARVSS